MTGTLLKNVTQAAQTADILVSDIREAHGQACGENPALEILLRDLIADAMKIKCRTAEIEACFK